MDLNLDLAEMRTWQEAGSRRQKAVSRDWANQKNRRVRCEDVKDVKKPTSGFSVESCMSDEGV